MSPLREECVFTSGHGRGDGSSAAQARRAVPASPSPTLSGISGWSQPSLADGTDRSGHVLRDAPPAPPAAPEALEAPAVSPAVVSRAGPPRIDVVVPVHNEQGALPGSIRRLHDFLSADCPSRGGSSSPTTRARTPPPAWRRPSPRSCRASSGSRFPPRDAGARSGRRGLRATPTSSATWTSTSPGPARPPPAAGAARLRALRRRHRDPACLAWTSCAPPSRTCRASRACWRGPAWARFALVGAASTLLYRTSSGSLRTPTLPPRSRRSPPFGSLA